MKINKLYILSNGEHSKIGITKNIDKRISTYTTHNPNTKIFYVYSFKNSDDAKTIESIIKYQNREKTVGRALEWFTMKVTELKEKIELIAKELNIDANIESIQGKQSISVSKKYLEICSQMKNLSSFKVLNFFLVNVDKNLGIEISQQELAKNLRLTRQTVSSCLDELISNKIIFKLKTKFTSKYVFNTEHVLIK